MGKADMQIDWDQKVAGIPLPEIRDMLRHFGRHRFDVHDLSKRLRSGRRNYPSQEERAKQNRKGLQILRALAASDLIKKDPFFPETYNLNQNGFALIGANPLPRMSRKAADKAIEKLRAKVAAINADPAYMHDITEICIFGSYIDDAVHLGDLDIGYTLKGRWNINDQADFEAREDALEDKYPSPQSLDSFAFWGEIIIKRHLRVNRRINLTPITRLEEMGCARQMIFPTEKFIPAKPGWKDERTAVRIVHDKGKALRKLQSAPAIHK